MKYLSLAIVPLAVGLLTPLFFGLMRRADLKEEAKMNERDFVMRWPSAWVWASIIGSVAFTAILILLNIFGEVKLLVNVITIPFLVPFIFGIYVFVREKIVVKKDMITVTPVFGKTRSYIFSKIEKLEEVVLSNGTTVYKVYKDKKIFFVSNFIPGCNLFIERVKREKIEIETADEKIQRRKFKKIKNSKKRGMIMKKQIETKDAPSAIGPYSQGISAGGFAFLSGQLPVDPKDGRVPGGIILQTRRVFENIASVLSARGLSLENVVKTTVFLKNMKDFSDMNGVYGEYFRECYPARSTVEVARLPKDVLIEIEAIAVES